MSSDTFLWLRADGVSSDELRDWLRPGERQELEETSGEQFRLQTEILISDQRHLARVMFLQQPGSLQIIGEILTGDPQPGDVGLTFRMFVAGMCANLFQLLFINVAMKYYDQIDVIPIFLTSLLIFNITEGCILLDEISLYGTNDIIFISFGIAVCVSGIIILMIKNADKAKLQAMIKDDDESD